MAGCVRWMTKLVRKKIFTDEDLLRSELRRCLSTIELVGLGTGSTLGAGIYILSGQVASESAGPAVVLSFLIAGVVAGLAGLCYAEFAARVPRAGSAYVYTYVTVGELMAFVIGWNILLEYIISVASLARALTSHVDYLTGNSIQQAFLHSMPISVPGLSSYPDFLALALVILATGLVAAGVKESTTVTIALTCVNLVVIVLIVICGFYNADFHNWQLDADELPASGAGSGGFVPFGFSGLMAGAATCFFAYVGFDFIASMGEEAEDCRWSIPVSMGATLTVNMVCYCLVAAVVTLMTPYFYLNVEAPVVYAFDQVGWTPARWIISLGAVCGMASSLMGAVFPMARVVYAMSSDGLIFRCLSTVSPRFRTPLLSTIASGALAGLLALLFDLKELIDMLSIGTLLAFGLVAVCVLILRYETEETCAAEKNESYQTKASGVTASNFKLVHLVKPCSDSPTESSARIVKISIAVMCVTSLPWAATVTVGSDRLTSLSGGTVAIATILSAVILATVFIICRQPQNPRYLRFKVPLVPLLPTVSTIINVYLMFKLSAVTWIRFGVWLILGFCIYFFYGLRHSSLNATAEERTLLFSSDEWTSTPYMDQPSPTGPQPSRDSNGVASSIHIPNNEQASPTGPHHDKDTAAVASNPFSHNPDQSSLKGPHHSIVSN